MRMLLTVDRLDRRKGHGTVLRALPHILKTCPDVVYVVVGFSGDLSGSELKALARSLNVERHVVFAGSVAVEKLSAIYRSCDIFVMPNYTLATGDTEGFGLVFLEAAACGKPAIGRRGVASRMRLWMGKMGFW
jgi:phosphatidylinositol alpha-1,6-mannosyltransferase